MQIHSSSYNPYYIYISCYRPWFRLVCNQTFIIIIIHIIKLFVIIIIHQLVNLLAVVKYEILPCWPGTIGLFSQTFLDIKLSLLITVVIELGQSQFQIKAINALEPSSFIFTIKRDCQILRDYYNKNIKIVPYLNIRDTVASTRWYLVGMDFYQIGEGTCVLAR